MNKILTGIVLISSLFGYMEWGKNQHLFLFQAEAEIMLKMGTDIKSVLHPFILLPLLGQLLLLASLFQQKPGKYLVLTGIICISLLMLILFFIGIITPNIKMFVSTLPFIISSVMTIRLYFAKSIRA